MLIQRNYLAVVRDIDTGRPCAVYDGRCFVRFHSVGPAVRQPPKGVYYNCVLKGRPMRLWQMYELDRWYTEEPVGEAI